MYDVYDIGVGGDTSGCGYFRRLGNVDDDDVDDEWCRSCC